MDWLTRLTGFDYFFIFVGFLHYVDWSNYYINNVRIDSPTRLSLISAVKPSEAIWKGVSVGTLPTRIMGPEKENWNSERSRPWHIVKKLFIP